MIVFKLLVFISLPFHNICSICFQAWTWLVKDRFVSYANWAIAVGSQLQISVKYPFIKNKREQMIGLQKTLSTYMANTSAYNLSETHPLPGRDCAMVRYNPLSGLLTLVSVYCEEKIPLTSLLCERKLNLTKRHFINL